MTARVERFLAACCQQAGSPGWGLGRKTQAKIHEGRVGPEEVLRWRVLAPAVLFAALALEATETCQLPDAGDPAGLIRQQWRFAAFCVTKGEAAARGAECRRLAEAVAAAVARENWAAACRAAIDAREIRARALDPDDTFFCGSPRRVLAENLYTAGASKEGISLWAVTWSIDCDAPPPGTGAAAPDPPALPSELYASWDPDTGPEHRDDYRKLAEAEREDPA